MVRKHFLLLIPLLLLIGIIGVYAQEIPNAQNYITPYIGECTSNPNDASGITPVFHPTLEQVKMESEIRMLREEAERTGIRNQSLELMTNRLSESYGQVIKPGEFYPATIINEENQPVPFNQNGTDNLQNVLLLNSSMTKVIRFAVEYNQATAGKIWAVVAYQGTGSSSTPDTVRIYYSTTGGSTWSLRVTIILGGTDKVNYDDLDLEIIEPTSGDKYLWCVYGLRASGGTGRYFSAGFSARITGTFDIGFFAFSWPGNDPAKRYYNVRITSDNTIWSSAAYVYIVCSFDSAAGSGFDNCQKLVRCTSPYTISPTFSYKGDRCGWYMGAPLTAGYHRTLFTDIAFFRNTNDSLIISFSGVPDSTKLFFSKLSVSAPPGAGNQYGFIGGNEPNDYKYGTQIATNGNTNGGCYAIFTQRTSGITRNKYFRTTNFGDFRSIAGQSVLLGHEVSNPDLMGLRNISTYVYTYTSYGTPNDSVKYHRGTHTGGTSTICERMNSNTYMTGTSTPGVGFRMVSGDSCLVGYIRSGPTQAWVVNGCSGTFTGINNNQLPAVYSLSQNYPNPFNPTTTISFSIPKAGLVSLKIYDVLGNEIATLVNENMNVNNYTVTWDANAFASGVYFYKLISDDFTDVKKMILVK